MKVILSRKGFDNQYGGQPSPILPDGTILSLPIPLKGEDLNFSDIKHNGKSYWEIIKELKPNSKITKNCTCHLDPDLRKKSLERESKWKPLFGQAGSSQGHLSNKGITIGDIFLFFGSFRQTKFIDNKLFYVKGAPEIHLIFGYLQVGKIHDVVFPKHILYHPHATGHYVKATNNVIYEASDSLNFMRDKAGADCLCFHNDLILTKEGMSKSKWNIPKSFKETDISYHSKKSFKDGYFQSAAKGQEFVISNGVTVLDWVINIILKGT